MQIGFCVYLCWLAVQDVREKSLSFWKLVAGAGVFLLWRLLEGRGLPQLVDMLPGVYCLSLSLLSRQQIGIGDAIVLLVLGICCGWRNCLAVVFVALILAGIWGMAGIYRKRYKRKDTLPWLPFLAAAYGICLFRGR